MPSGLMPQIYRWLLTASGFTYLAVGIIDGRESIWGPSERVILTIAGVVIIAAAWNLLHGSLARTGAYLAGIAGLFEVVTHFMLWVEHGTVYNLRSSLVWSTFTTYTVLLLAFGWVSRGPR